MSQRDSALAFVRRFGAGDVDGLASLLADELHFVGPYLEATSKAEYLAALRANPPTSAATRVLSVTVADDAVAVFYDYEKGDNALTIAQLFRFRGDLISETRVVFTSRDR